MIPVDLLVYRLQKLNAPKVARRGIERSYHHTNIKQSKTKDADAHTHTHMLASIFST